MLTALRCVDPRGAFGFVAHTSREQIVKPAERAVAWPVFFVRPRRLLMPRVFTAIVLPLLLAPSLGAAQRADIRAPSSNAGLVIPTTSVTRLSSGEGTRGHFWAGAGIGLLGGALIGGAIGSTTRLCFDSCTADEARSGAIKAGVVLGGTAGFLFGGVIGALIRSDRSSSFSVGPR